MKYLLLAYGIEEQVSRLTEAQRMELGNRCKAQDVELHATGKVSGSFSLEWDSKSLRRNAGKLIVTDGPYIDTKEVVGGLVIIEADDFEEAVRIASLHPAAQFGEELGFGIELRPIGHCELMK